MNNGDFMNNRQTIIEKALDRLNGFLMENGLQKATCAYSSKEALPTVEFYGGVCFSILDATAMPAAKIEEESALRGMERTIAIAPFFPPTTAELLSAKV